MLSIPPPQHRARRAKPVSNALALVAATYDVGSSVTLKFNKVIDITQLNGPEIQVNDVDSNYAYAGLEGPATRVDPFTVRVDLEVAGPAVGPGTLLTASDDTRIRSIPGAQSWAGVTALPLPYP